MSVPDPLAGLVTQMVAGVENALADAALSLGAAANPLQTQLTVGQVIPATVMAPQGGQDQIQILGQTVAAQLPPNIYPGETLLVQVTGFSGNQILVRNLGPAAAPPEETASPVPAAQSVAPPPSAAPSQTSAPPAVESSQSAAPAEASVSPPRAVFVAASVRPAPAAPAAPPAPPPRAQLIAQIPRAVEPGSAALNARIAASQTPKIVARASDTPPAPAPSSRPPIVPIRPSPAPSNGAAAIVQRVIRSVGDLLRAAKLPDIPLTRSAAAVAPQAPAKLPAVLQRLDAALAATPDDPRAATLRTLIAFTSQLDPASEETLSAQIEAYVSHVVEGTETKLQQLLQARSQSLPQPSLPQVHAAPPSIASARADERAAAITHDLKSLVLSLLRDPPATRSPALSQALGETLVTLTGTQINVLSATIQDPSSIAIVLPFAFYEGGKPAQIRISRDAQSRVAKLDAEDFHVGFVLDTANLGTVAVDLQSMARSVKVDVKTERQFAVKHFSQTLGRLQARLEQLRYRVASIAANPLGARTAPAQKAQNEPAPQRGLDLRA
jgi:hypothetical protein